MPVILVSNLALNWTDLTELLGCFDAFFDQFLGLGREFCSYFVGIVLRDVVHLEYGQKPFQEMLACLNMGEVCCRCIQDVADSIRRLRAV
ncbi:hypothetical protein KC337_g97 [Hortaea werneckii]|nr:hypothetical protein KC337_g97 [Hortaea werneckii]